MLTATGKSDHEVGKEFSELHRVRPAGVVGFCCARRGKNKWGGCVRTKQTPLCSPERGAEFPDYLRSMSGKNGLHGETGPGIDSVL